MKPHGNRGRAATNRIGAAMASQPDSPCVAHKCPRAADCALEQLACAAFEGYLLEGLVHAPDQNDLPTGQRYDVLFSRVDEPLPRKTTLVP